DKHLHHQVIPISDLIGKGKKQLSLDQVPTARVAEYAGEDADVAWRLCELLEPILEQKGFRHAARTLRVPSAGPDGDGHGTRSVPAAYLYDDLEVPLIEVLAEVEFNGIRL